MKNSYFLVSWRKKELRGRYFFIRLFKNFMSSVNSFNWATKCFRYYDVVTFSTTTTSITTLHYDRA